MSCEYDSAGKMYYKMWAGLNTFDPLVLSGVKISMDCMNLVIVTSRYTRVSVR